ncbi:MAG: VacJ family lipoprotein [Chromatiales bacterium]|nr:VacJ family lipoprotein [Chromatiales bacterium]
MRALLMVGLAVVALSGCATSPMQDEVTYDPFEPVNRTFFGINDALDKAILGPVARVYADVVPAPVRENVYSFFDNLAYPNVVVNDILQGKFAQAAEDAMRFLVNSTIGFGGIADVATGFGLERHDEDLGQTLAVWGFGEGPYFELPFFGPNATRDLPDIPASTLTDASYYLGTWPALPLTVLKLVDTRARLDSAIRVRDRSALDPYVFQREAYMQRRRHLANDGDAPGDAFDLPPPPRVTN